MIPYAWTTRPPWTQEIYHEIYIPHVHLKRAIRGFPDPALVQLELRPFDVPRGRLSRKWQAALKARTSQRRVPTNHVLEAPGKAETPEIPPFTGSHHRIGHVLVYLAYCR